MMSESPNQKNAPAYKHNESTNELILSERTVGTFTVRDTAAVTIADNTDYNIRVWFSGNDHKAWVTGANELSYTSASHNTATKSGIRAVDTDQSISHFAVWPIGTGGEHSNLDNYTAA